MTMRTIFTLAAWLCAAACFGQVKISQYPNTNRLGPNQLFLVTAGGTNMNVKKSDMPAAIDAVANLNGSITNGTVVSSFWFGAAQTFGFASPDGMNVGYYWWEDASTSNLVWEANTASEVNFAVWPTVANVSMRALMTNAAFYGPTRPLYQSTALITTNDLSERMDASPGILRPGSTTNGHAGSLVLKAATGITLATNGNDLEVSSSGATNGNPVIEAGTLTGTNGIFTNLYVGTANAGTVRVTTSQFDAAGSDTNKFLSFGAASNIQATAYGPSSFQPATVGTNLATAAGQVIDMSQDSTVCITNALAGNTIILLTNIVDRKYFVLDCVADGTPRVISFATGGGTITWITTNGITDGTNFTVAANKVGTIGGRAWLKAGVTNIKIFGNVQP